LVGPGHVGEDRPGPAPGRVPGHRGAQAIEAGVRLYRGGIHRRRHLRDAGAARAVLSGTARRATMSVKLIHIGVGARGRHWLDIVSRHPDFVSAACVDPDERALGAARALPGQERGHFFASLEEALAHVEADAALVSSPSFLHARHTLEALDAGLAVM